jgi:MFS family permease
VIHLRQLGPAVIRHVEAYGQLAAAAARDMRDIGRRRAMLAVVGMVLSIALVILAGATAIAAGWDTPWRWWVAAGVLAALAIATFVCLSGAFAAMPRSTHMQALKDEWQKDKAWLSTRDRERPLPVNGSLTAQDPRRNAPDARTPSMHDA